MNQQDLEQILKNEPGDPRFVEFAQQLFVQGQNLRSIEVCLAGLSANPAAHEGRLLLAQIYFSCGYYPFATRELLELHRALPDNQTIVRLLEKLSPGSTAGSSTQDSSETLAESDFDLDVLESLGEEE